ncbi:MAG: TonB-dependent receptor plug domain-containing protein, partial [Bacteroidales bacterium]|nr:TonB-dependent receptor plug domain-containing protein [Bacteroidales bacterium]
MKYLLHLFLLGIVFCIADNEISAQSKDTILLKEVEIKSSRFEIIESQNLQAIKIITANDLHLSSDNDISTGLKENSLVDIRQRSFSSVQSDINIRGGSFDQNIVLLNGINLSDVQTGHHNLNIPVNNSNIAAVEVLSGPACRVFGPNALTGAINFISIIPDKNSLELDFSFGSFNTKKLDFGAKFITGVIKHSLSLSYSASDGFMTNTDYDRKSLYYENNANFKLVKFKTMIGLLGKNFGSNSFYTPMYENQYEKIKTGFVAIKLSGGNKFHWDYNLYYRRLLDQYQLFREGDG